MIDLISRLGEVLSVAVLAQEVLPPLELHHLDLLVAAVSLDGRRDLSAFDVRLADGDPFTVSDEQNPIELDLVAFLGVEPFHPQILARLDAVLLAARRYHCIHRTTPPQIRHMLAVRGGL